MRELIIGTDFSGIGSPEQAIKNLKIPHKVEFACDIDKYAKQTYLANHECKRFYDDITERNHSEIEQLDLYVAGFPCQAFSVAGKRKGFDDVRGTLFFNVADFIKVNQPKVFILENVKGLLSSKSSITYKNTLYLLLFKFNKIEKWQNINSQKNNCNLLSQDIISYLYLNWSKKLGLKKNKSGISLIRNSELKYEKLEVVVSNGLKRRLKFLKERISQIEKNYNCLKEERILLLEEQEKDLVLNQKELFLIKNLQTKVIDLLERTENINENISLFQRKILNENLEKEKLFTTLMGLNLTITPQTFMYVLELNIIRLIILALDSSPNLWKEIWLILTEKKVFTGSMTFDIILSHLDNFNYTIYYQVLNTKEHGIPQNRERIFIVGFKNYREFSFPKTEPLKIKLKDVLEKDVDEKYYLSDTMIKGLLNKNQQDNGFTFKPKEGNDIGNCVTARCFKMGADDNYIKVNSQKEKTDKVLQINESKESGGKQPYQQNRIYDIKGVSPALNTIWNGGNIINTTRIRRLTPLECFRLQGFPDSYKKVVSNTQLYKQAGNSISVPVIQKIISNIYCNSTVNK